MPSGLQVGAERGKLGGGGRGFLGHYRLELLRGAQDKAATHLAPLRQLLLARGERSLVLPAQRPAGLAGLLLPAAQFTGLRVEFFQGVQVTDVGRQPAAQPGAGLGRRLPFPVGLDAGLHRPGTADQQHADAPEKPPQQGGRGQSQHDFQAQRQNDQGQKASGVRHGPEGGCHEQGSQLPGLRRVQVVGANQLEQRQCGHHHQRAAQHAPGQARQVASQEHQYPVGRRNQRQRVAPPAQPAGQCALCARHEAVSGGGQRHGDA